MLNAAILLKGEKQIEVEVRRLDELHIEFASLDFNAYGKATTVEEIQDCHNPYDSFALHKAALIACGVIPKTGEANLQEILKRIGGGIYLSTRVCNVPKGSGLGTSSILSGGIYLSTRVCNVPKGSGLGTSSILSGAAVKAIGAFFGQEWSDETLLAGSSRRPDSGN